MPILPLPPRVELVTTPAEPGDHPYLGLDDRRVEVRVDGRSATGVYTAVTRRALDAVVIIAYSTGPTGPRVYLRSCVRPPLGFRGLSPSLWELPAGLVEPGETPIEAGARELLEELGFAIPEAEFSLLGAPVMPAPALLAEVQTFVRVRVDPALRGAPTEDGSPFELGGSVIDVTLADALAACAAGEIGDAKTELGLRRLKEALA